MQLDYRGGTDVKRLCLIIFIGLLAAAVVGCQGVQPENPEKGQHEGEETVEKPGESPDLASLSDRAFPFPRKQAVEAWELTEKRLLVKRVEKADTSYYVYDPAAESELQRLVGFVQNATFRREEEGQLVFIARGGADTGAYEFPYRLRCNPVELACERSSISLPLEQEVAFGKHTWRQVLTNIEYTKSGLMFELEPHPEAVMAGSHTAPITAVHYDEEEHVMIVHLYQVELESAKLKDQLAHNRFASASAVETASLEQTAGKHSFEQDSGILTAGWPYGLPLSNPQFLREDSAVVLRLQLSEFAETYSFSIVNREDSPDTSILLYSILVQ
jgi:hypothetical protein